jgi:hypothetical protein
MVIASYMTSVDKSSLALPDRKVCAKCKIEKLSVDFPKHSYSLDGLYSYCKNCVSVKNKESKDKKREQRIGLIKEKYPGADINVSKYANSTK